MLNMKVIVAFEKNRGIGNNGSIPWFLKDDLKFFQKVTNHPKNPVLKNVVIMGRKTWESLPFKPLKHRLNCVISQSQTLFENALCFSSLGDCLDQLSYMSNINKENIFVIGGTRLYKEAINHPICRKIYTTEIYESIKCDTFFPEIPEDKFCISKVSDFKEENGVYYRHITYTTDETKKWKNEEEDQYIQTLNMLLKSGIKNVDRTGVGTLSLFGKMFKYDLSDTFPLLTTKRMFVRGIFEELKLYLSGKTDNKILQQKNIHIWDGNTSREFLDNGGLGHYPEGDMGETYGFNFRHFGGTYKTCNENYEGQGFDQVAYAIDLIRNNPTSRRIIIDIWNCDSLKRAALPPCLCKYQFYVNTEDNKLDLMIYIRSSDFFLANNWNVITGAFLVHMICNLNGIDYTPGTLTVVTGDTHLYLSHINQAEENLKRTPKPYPKLIVKEKKNSLEEFVYEDMRIIGYNPDKNIKATMAV